ncbi:hypothetical protein TGGT1_217178 [Toxoplasma gondii GT1]|uniref:Uncharacterized protein n=5 Tax=Toxoplasma gondii TaxID=5811 RepID=S7UL22_TOXGG|nr:hypothetical protein TGGT1_217178 [Toxoplasma gondii GT1]KAF4639778.1 hypothetical protein TGRH88_055500 [Toxoplasma gondii]RQX67214.1 hypothetical protein TGCAST_217178 [Toxoplasma gondii CAST]
MRAGNKRLLQSAHREQCEQRVEGLDEATGDVEAEYMQRLHRTRQAAETAECCASLNDEPDIRVFFLMSPQNFMRVELTIEARVVRIELPFKDMMNGVYFFRGENPEDVRMLVRFRSAPRVYVEARSLRAASRRNIQHFQQFSRWFVSRIRRRESGRSSQLDPGGLSAAALPALAELEGLERRVSTEKLPEAKKIYRKQTWIHCFEFGENQSSALPELKNTEACTPFRSVRLPRLLACNIFFGSDKKRFRSQLQGSSSLSSQVLPLFPS